MASTKANVVVWDDVTLTAGAGADSTVSDVQNWTDGYGGVALLKLTNGATGPTVASAVQLEASGDGVNFYGLGGPISGGVANNGITDLVIDVPIGVMYLRATAGSNTDQNVTVRLEVSEVTEVR